MIRKLQMHLIAQTQLNQSINHLFAHNTSSNEAV